MRSSRLSAPHTIGSRTATLQRLLVALLLMLAPGQSVAGVSVKNNRIMRDGEPFIIKGYIFESLLEPAEKLQECKQTPYCQLRIDGQAFYFGRGKFAEKSGLDLAQEWGANTIRLNLNQAALDPQNPSYSEDYLKMIKRAVSDARGRGFAVVLTLFDERNFRAPASINDANPKTPLNNDVSLRAAQLLARSFGDDGNVMLELLNEPWSPTRTDIGWRIYLNGGAPNRGKYTGVSFVGVNQIIDAIRAEHARNLIIVQGLSFSMQGYPGGVRDPMNNVAFAVHPFFLDGRDAYMDWDGNFGDFSKKMPMILTAWDTLPGDKNWCDKWGWRKPYEFLEYLKERRLGMIAYALDIPFTMSRDFRQKPIVPTSSGHGCAGGHGKLIIRYFQGEDIGAELNAPVMGPASAPEPAEKGVRPDGGR